MEYYYINTYYFIVTWNAIHTIALQKNAHVDIPHEIFDILGKHVLKKTYVADVCF